MKQLGNHGHDEHGWSENIRENIVQLNYQLVRTNDFSFLKYKLSQILYLLSNSITEVKDLYIEVNSQTNNTEYMLNRKLSAIGMYIGERNENLILLYKMIGYTRDIINGKGEYHLTYMMIVTWYSYFPDCAKFALKCCVETSGHDHPYGSWKDVKYFCNYCREVTGLENHPLIEYAVSLTNRQLFADYNLFLKGETTNFSLAAKWIPREKSLKFGWIFLKLSQDFYFSNRNSSIRSINKANMEYRKMCSELNRILDTIQIKQCQHRWKEIDYKKITAATKVKQARILLNEKNMQDNDRIICASNFLMNALSNNKNSKKPICIIELVKRALSAKKLEAIVLNSEWKNQEKINIGNMLPMLDTSLSIWKDDAIYAGIGLACKVAENSTLGKRILCFGSGPPIWIDLSKDMEFTEMIQHIHNICTGKIRETLNFYSAIDMITDSIILNKMTQEEVMDIKFAIFSNMQFERISKGHVYDILKEKYKLAGMKIANTEYSPPHILFWNLNCTNGFPVFYNDKNVSMVSGYSLSVLDFFTTREIKESTFLFERVTPWSKLKIMLDNTRYKKMQDFIMENQNM